MNVRLMSYNIYSCRNFVTRELDYDSIAETVRRCGADIVGLQEVRDEGPGPDNDPQARILAEKLGFYSYFAEAIVFPGRGPYGNALLSRYPILSAETVLIPDPDPRTGNKYYETRCVLKARIAVPGVPQGLTVCVTHFGLNTDEQENAVQTVLSLLDEERCVLMGDFNVTPSTALLRPIQERMQDASSTLGEVFSFPVQAPKRKIDYIFVSRDITVTEAQIPAIGSSDHCPHVASVTLA